MTSRVSSRVDHTTWATSAAFTARAAVAACASSTSADMDSQKLVTT